MLNVCSFLPAPGRSESHSDEDDMRRLGCTADFISGVTIPKCSWGQAGTRNKEGCPGKILTFHRETAFLVSLYYVGNMQKNFFFFLMWTILKAFIENLLQYCFCLMFWFFGHEVCPILAPQPGIDPALPALDSEILMTGL